MPSPEYRNAGHGIEYGNKQDSPQLDMEVEAVADDGITVSSSMWIKAARNEGLSVHVPSGNAFTTKLRDPSREFSAYIPGLAGIPLSEEKKAKLIVQRLAAAGDANTVLRNVLHRLKDLEIDGKNGLFLVQDLVSSVIGDITISVDFNDDRHTLIEAKFQTADMKASDPKRFKPLELAGIGFLQIIQIFSYIVYFQPVIILIDEPDSHLHPTAQERLVGVLSTAARRFGTQVVLTTHSPSIVRTLPAEAKVIWMKDGRVQPNGDTEGRKMMGWGLLDRRLLFMTEDTETGMLQSILAQWPHIDRQVAIWPFHGSSKLPSPDIIAGLVGLMGGSIKVILHRDRDFLMPTEVSHLSEPYELAGHTLWFTKNSDIEAYWTEIPTICEHFGISLLEGQDLIEESVNFCCADNKSLESRRRKRMDAMNKIGDIKKGMLPQHGDAEVEAESCVNGYQYKVLGKDLVSAIRDAARRRSLRNSSSFGKIIPQNRMGSLATDLELTLRTLLR
jgi:hypothetical protein